MSGYRLGCCVSAHGFGHSARTSAVLEALADLAEVEAVIVSTVPEQFFRASFSGNMTYHNLQTDVGLVQRTALQEDIPATIRQLADFYPLRPEYIDRLAAIFAGCDLILCDIAPAGIVAAEKIGIPSVLLENFTWDWIYRGYGSSWAGLQPYVGMFEELYGQADYHIQTVPVCAPCRCDLLTGPIARRLRRTREATRQLLGLDPAMKAVLVSMGGEGLRGLRIRWPENVQNIVLLVPGATAIARSPDNLRVLPFDEHLHHPDLVASCDAVIGKAGYSTIAEVYQGGVPFGYLGRPGFPESDILTGFIRDKMAGIEMIWQDFQDGDFRSVLENLLRLERIPPRKIEGADRCAAFLAHLLRRQQLTVRDAADD